MFTAASFGSFDYSHLVTKTLGLPSVPNWRRGCGYMRLIIGLVSTLIACSFMVAVFKKIESDIQTVTSNFYRAWKPSVRTLSSMFTISVRSQESKEGTYILMGSTRRFRTPFVFVNTFCFDLAKTYTKNTSIPDTLQPH